MPQKVATEEGLEQLDLLEKKIMHTVKLLQSARLEKDVLVRENSQIRGQLAEQEHNFRLLQERLHRFEKERQTVKARVQKVLDQVDALTQAATDAD